MADSDGEFKEHTVIRIPALPITVYHLNTRSPFPDARPMATTCVMQHDSVPHVPSGCVGQAPVPSILPMACLSWESTHHDPHGIPARSSLLSWPPPQPHAASITLVRKWQTRAVDPEKDGACRIDFEFTIPCKFLLKVECLVPVGLATHIETNPAVELPSVYHTEHYCTKYFHVAMQQVENPHTQAHSWPPPRIVRWEFRASHQGAADPFLDIVLSFELPQG